MDHSRFDWDDANISHIAEHGVTPEQAEYALDNDPYDLGFEIRKGEERLSHIGQTADGSILVLITTERASKTRVITAFPANHRQKIVFINTRRKTQQ